MELMIDIFMDAVIDTAKLIPFLFLTYLAMEYLENKAGEKTVNMLLGAGKKGPLIGGILGVVPQCGFSAAAASLYSGGVITIGTMIAVFLSTSDEMLPILISERTKAKEIVWILGVISWLECALAGHRKDCIFMKSVNGITATAKRGAS